MLETLKNAFKIKEIRTKILWMLLLLFVFRLGCYIPVPGLMREQFSDAIVGSGNGISFLQVMSSVTGSALANGTLFALGIGPYINASIIVQLLCFGIPALERLSKEGEEGRKKIAQITRYIAIGLAILQSVGIIVNFAVAQEAVKLDLFAGNVWLAGVYMTIVYTAGACLVMWLGDRITEKGVGNGMSMIIFIGIISTAGETILREFGKLFGIIEGADFTTTFWGLMAFILVTILLFAAIVTVDLGERKIPVQYAKQIKGRKQYGGQRTEIPMRISASGVMPLIFAFAIISVPSMIMSLFFPEAAQDPNNWWTMMQTPGTGWYPVYVLLLCVLIFAFAFFYAMIQFNPDDVAKSIQQNGGFIPGIRPGRYTAEYLKKISNRITLFGAIYLSLVAFVPSIAFAWANSNMVNVFSTTGILIVVSVAMEFDKQLQSQMMMKSYKGFLK